MSYVSVPVATKTFLRIAAFLRESGSDRDPVAVFEDAANYWIDNAEWKRGDLLPDAIEKDARGYIWKIQKDGDRPNSSLFLPPRTALRIKAGNGFEYATVEGDTLIYRGEKISPNQFAKRATGTDRDAWRDVWIKRPSDPDYRQADALRHELLTS